jgi:acyl carrier protein
MEPSSSYEAGQAVGRFAAYAVVGLLSLGCGIFFIIALIKAITKKTRGWITATVISGVLALFGVVGLIGVAANSMVKMAKEAAKTAKGKKKTMASKDDRYQLEVPANWRDMPELHQEAEVRAGNTILEQYVIVLENPKSDFVGTLADFDELMIEQMKGNVTDGEVSGPEVRSTGTYPAIHRRLAGTVNKLGIVYHLSSVETDTAFYQVLMWTTKSRESAAAPVFRDVVESFFSKDGPPKPKLPQPSATAGTHDRVVWLVAEQLGLEPEKVKAESRFIEHLGADSLDTVELVMLMEEEFYVSVPDEVAAKLLTVGDLVRWLEKQAVEVE